MIEHTLFYIFSALLIFSSSMVIVVRNPVYAALFLVLSFFFCSGIWLLLQAEFLAITLVLVYVGAVMVLFLFVVMMIDINLAKISEGFARYLPIGILVAVLMSVAMAVVLKNEYFSDLNQSRFLSQTELSNTEILGLDLYTNYLYPFEIAGAILLVAIIAAISLTFRDRKASKKQNPDQQVAVDPKERVRLVNMPTEKQE